MGTAIKHPVPDRVKPATVGFKGLTVQLRPDLGHMMLPVRVECFLLDKHRLLSFVPLICGYAAVYVMSTK